MYVHELLSREAIVSSLKAIHDAGVQHNHLDEYNVVINERGRPFIIDFEHAEEHACGRKMDIVVNALRPAPSQFGCTELWNVIDDMGLWKPCELRLSVCMFFALFSTFYSITLVIIDGRSSDHNA